MAASHRVFLGKETIWPQDYPTISSKTMLVYFVIIYTYISFKPGKTSRKGDNPGDEDLYEMVLRSQVSIKF